MASRRGAGNAAMPATNEVLARLTWAAMALCADAGVRVWALIIGSPYPTAQAKKHGVQFRGFAELNVLAERVTNTQHGSQ